MAKSNIKVWHPDFIDYMNFIANHPNYEGLPINKKKDGSLAWIATAQSEIGQARIKWCENKAKELGFDIKPGVYAEVMREIHPTKWKVCQTCGKIMSIYYHYPSANCINAIYKKFNVKYTEIDHISDIWDDLINKGYTNNEISAFLIDYGKLSISPVTSSKTEVIDALEYTCRIEGKGILSPGAMSNFPDRFDGFHTYNRCCRSTQDKGRSKENLKSYSKDRRAYEYWSDGNIHAANQFMSSAFFKDVSADHIGPISLGFVHDSHYLRPLTTSENSTKRDRLQKCDIDTIIEIEKRTGICPMSWFSKLIWNYIKENYESNISKISSTYRDALKQNMSNFMYILWNISSSTKNGNKFLISTLLSPHFKDFDFTYSFDHNGNIINSENRHYTERNKNEVERYIRIAIESVYSFNDKANRNIENDLTPTEISQLNLLCSSISSNSSDSKKLFTELMESIQKRIIGSL